MIRRRGPRVVVIDGVSSSGRTSLVNRFCEIVDGGWVAVHIDEFAATLPPGMWERCGGSDEGWAGIGMAFNDHLAVLVGREPRVIADAFYLLPTAREHLFALLGREKVFHVQLICELPELERRERARGDRRPGLARSQFEAVYAFDGYDLRIDSTSRLATACARELEAALTESP